MKRNHLLHSILPVLVGTFLISMIGCSQAGNDADGKVPITTSSETALTYYLQGRDLSEKLRGQESIEYFEKAIAEDPDFAMAHLALAFVTPSAKGFFEELDKAVSLADRVTDGESLWILGTEAGVNAYAMQQRDYYQKLVALFPNDERAHNLLGNNYFGQQEWQKAIDEYYKAIGIAPDFSQPYNQMGYAHRFLGNYSEAEKAFLKYIELIPDDPNPYDSYAELLMKIGRYDESITNYREALKVDPNFVASHIGIATNLVLMGKHEEARQQILQLHTLARNDGERRAAHFAATVTYVDEGQPDKALEEQNRQFALAEKIDDAANMAADLVTMGNIYLESGRYDEAHEKFQAAVETVQNSNLGDDIKANAQRFFLFNSARVAMKKKDFETAWNHQKDYQQQVEAINNPFQVRLAHELAGVIALEEENYNRAIQELEQANQQNPYNFYRLAKAYAGLGDREKAQEYCTKTVNFNGLNNINQAYCRHRAAKMLQSM